MWIHVGIFLMFGILFFLSHGFFSKAGAYLAGHFPDFFCVSKKQMRKVLILLFAANSAGMLLAIAQNMRPDTAAEGYLIRPERGAGSTQEELIVTDGEFEESIVVDVKEPPYTKEEAAQMLDEVLESLDERILGENENFDKIEHPMNLMAEVDGTCVQIEWNTSQPMYLDWEGTIGTDVPEEGVSVELTGQLSLEGADSCLDTGIYRKTVTVFPEKKSSRDAFIQQVRRALGEQSSEGGMYQYLPENLDGKSLSWSRPADRTGFWVVAFAAVIGVLVLLSDQSRRRQKEKEMRRQMLLDYPEIVQKLILLMRAGASTRRAVGKIALDYRRETQLGKERRSAYDEILRVYYEMEQGAPEEEAYRHLGIRCRIPEYRTLSTLLIQNLKRGNGQFFHMMEQERERAFAQRKKMALIQGEEAGTKLLMPMAVMLLLVLMILLVPSFLTMI